jgi:hypothetical protein
VAPFAALVLLLSPLPLPSSTLLPPPPSLMLPPTPSSTLLPPLQRMPPALSSLRSPQPRL